MAAFLKYDDIDYLVTNTHAGEQICKGWGAAEAPELVMNKEGSAAINATKEQQLESKLIGLEKMRDNELARFVVTLMQYERWEIEII